MRDLLLDRRPKDFDVATERAPRRRARAVPQLAHHRPALPAGARALRGGKVIEVATFRRSPIIDADPLENGNGTADVDL